jgi:pimeloyl-ACP methyl ester carboxylesterase
MSSVFDCSQIADTPSPGPTYEWATSLYNSWIDDYDWYAAQKEMYRYPHFISKIEDVSIHFLHARAEESDAIPILLIHGWPGSFWEFSQVWEPLSHPSDPDTQAFHVVVPSMPGFCWSDWPPHPGWTLQDNARIFDKLMKKLGYNEYMVQCGDWGHFVGRELGARYSESCKYCNFAPSPLPKGVKYTEREKAVADRAGDWLENHMGYAICMRTRVRQTSMHVLHFLLATLSVWKTFTDRFLAPAAHDWLRFQRQSGSYIDVGRRKV